MRKTIDKPAVFAAALLVAIGGLIYELLLGTASSYLFGDSITSFSLSIGTMLFGMGIGSLLSAKLLKNATTNFVLAELLLSVVGGLAVVILFAAFVFTKIYWLIFILLSISIGILIGLEIPLMVRIAKGAKNNVEHILSRVLALDYIGALLASILFPFILLPYLGLIRTGFAMALLNVLLALFILRRAKTGPRHTIIQASTFLVIILFIAGLGYANTIERKIQTAQYRDPVVYYKLSPYQKITVTNYRDDVRLYLNDQLQFSSVDEARYHETLAHAAMTSAGQTKQVLILGGGDGMIAREVLRYTEVEKITLVDIDPAVTGVAKSNRLLADLNKHSLDDPRVHVMNEDAFTYVRDSHQNYDVVISDLVDPSNEKVSKLYSSDFYSAVNQHLSPNGIFITQATSSFFTPNAHQLIAQTMRDAAGSHDRDIVPLGMNVPSFGEWSFIINTPDEEQLFTKRHVPDDVSFVSINRLHQARQMPADFKPTISKNTVSTLLSPKIYTTYQDDMRKWRYD